MKLQINALSAQHAPCYKAGVISLTLELSKDQILRLLDQVAAQVPPRELVLMLDSVLECAEVQR